ncbi:histidine phosphatase family protein [Solwaraspora sp. WMMD406]|uniref:SixA phosphatase family protein n=1 Tax=Solwaraspora sp. WMMD406 TaxID=3016095 RepID=UPI002415D063|nr:histidine phosphatase family protein [Solwaraspora sp. WMMD406]MDG4762936.1 histidine phosphatase family protein [Solwaraspora sp. WMMD406]
MTRRTIVLLRHAKAEPPDALGDLERGLTPRGHSDAAHAGDWLAGQGLWPELVICSPAKRTRQTWREASAAGDEVPAIFEPSLYGGTADDLQTIVRRLDDTVRSVLIVGHNPTISHFSAILDPAGADDTGLRTCGVAIHQLAGPWTDCGPESAPIVDSYTARAASVS